MINRHHVATVLTACGIETTAENSINSVGIFKVATVLTACGIETISWMDKIAVCTVATVLTACGIETLDATLVTSTFYGLQQCLPLAVLKLFMH